MNHPKFFFSIFTDRSFALNQSPACATSIKVGTSVMKVETFIGSKATWRHQGCTAASMGISFDLPLSSPAAHFTTAKAGGKCHMKAISVGSKKITLFAALSCCHFPSNFLCILSARSATDARSATQVFWKRRQLLRFMIGVGDVGLPGTVRGHFKERGDGDRGISCTFPEIAFSHSRLSHWG